MRSARSSVEGDLKVQVEHGRSGVRELPDLRAAADAVLAGLSRADLPIGTSELREALVGLVTELERGIPAARSDSDPALRRRLLTLLRAQLISTWAASRPAPPAASMLEVLVRLEASAAALDARIPGATTLGYPTALEFVAGVAHDLRSPLTSILFLAETLRGGQSGPVNDAQRRQLGIVYAAALGLVSVASDIIELVRGGDGLIERTPTPFSVTEMLESVCDIVRPLAEERSLGVHLFPPSIDHRMGHPLALSRVLLNLTTNGLKYTTEGFVEISVREVTAARVEFAVRDTGPGFTKVSTEELYRPFRRSGGGRKQGFSGSGLGLAISRKLVAAMGSSLQVDARVGRGTRFYFELDLPPAVDGDC